MSAPGGPARPISGSARQPGSAAARPQGPGSAMGKSPAPQAGPPRPGGGASGRAPSQGPAARRVACNICKRMFAEDRIQSHIASCRSHANVKRQPFDSSKQRLGEVGNEKDIRRLTASKRPPKLLNIPWKDAHNNWIGAKGPNNGGGGRQSSVGRGTSSGMDDGRINCPGCGRKFNKQAAEKHIPYCTAKNR